MHWETIRKDTTSGVPPRLADYERARSDFTWRQARTELDGLPGGGLNIAHEAVDRHAASDQGDKVALRCVARDDSVSTITYAELARRTARFANVLRSLGVGRGDRVFTLLGRCPELYTTVLGTLKNTSVLCPLFSAFGPDPVEQRLRLGDARVLITTAALYRRKVAERRASVPGLEHVLIVGPGDAELYPPQVALVGFGRVVDRPCAVDGLLGVRPVVTATLSADHRATDGAVGARYLTAVTRLLQNPEQL